MQTPIQAYLDTLLAQVKGMHEGELASYIPELTKANPDWAAICVVTMDGTLYCAGDVDAPFTIQSISKAFVYATALADRGHQPVLRKVGVEPSGEAFNSISLHPQTGAPLNPMINAGAIAVTSLVAGSDSSEQWRRIERSMADFIGHGVRIDEAVYRSESETGHRNRAIAWMLKNFGIIEGDPMAVLDNYFRQCSVLVNCRDIATMAATLARGGVNPITGVRALPSEQVERVLSVMATCGMYDYAGSWLTEVGMPAKSGVGGGIVAVLPGRFGIGVFSPRLDGKGNSVRGIEVCKRMSKELSLNLFSPAHDPRLALGRIYTGAAVPSRRRLSVVLQDELRQRAHRIKYLRLQGMLAIDGIEYVIRKMHDLAPEADSFILDMHRVDGISESAARLLNLARIGFVDKGIAVVFSRIGKRSAITAPMGKPATRSDRGYLSFEDNDLAAEWCENRLLRDLEQDTAAPASLDSASLLQNLPPALLSELEAASRQEVYACGAQILVRGQVGDGRIFFIQSGAVSVLVPLTDSAHQRMAKLGSGMVFGEMVLLGQNTRSASVVADSDVVCRILEKSDIERISERTPQLKIILLENLAREIASNLRRTTEWLAALA